MRTGFRSRRDFLEIEAKRDRWIDLSALVVFLIVVGAMMF